MEYMINIDLLNKNDSHTKIIELVKPISTVLEFGCASGEVTKYLNNEKKCKVYIVEVNSVSFNKAVQFAEQGLCDDIMNFRWVKEFENILFDYVIFSDVLEHLIDPESVLEKVKGFLKDDGEILISIPNIAHNEIVESLYNNEFNYSDAGILDSTHIKFFAYKNLPTFFKKCGYTIKDIDYITKESTLPIHNKGLNKLLRERKLGNVFQFIIILQKSECSSSKFVLVKLEEKVTQKIYFDYGLGYNENDVLIFQRNDEINFSYNFLIPQGVKKIRFDPIDNQLCCIKNLKLFTPEGKLSIDSTNGIYGEELIIFDSIDPKIIFDNNQEEKQATIHGELHVLEDPFQYNIISDLLEKVIKTEFQKNKIILSLNQNKQELDLLKDKMKEVESTNAEQKKENKNLNDRFKEIEFDKNDLKLREQKHLNSLNNLEVELITLKSNLNLIKNSKSWRITQPIRYFADKIKSIIRKSVEIIVRLMKCCMEHGCVYTFKLILKNIFKNNKKTVKTIKKYQDKLNADISDLDNSIEFSILLPLYNTPLDYLCSTIESVLNQTYDNWELCIVDGSDLNEDVIKLTCAQFMQKSTKINYKKIQNRGISENSNIAAEMATKEYLVLLDHDDILTPNALYQNARAISLTNADVLYSDEDHLNSMGEHVNPFFKPDWSVDLLMSQMYVCHLFVFRKELFNKVGKFRQPSDGSQDYDLMLRFSRVTEHIVHIPLILYSWRESSTSTAVNPNSKPYAQNAGLNSLNDYLFNRYKGEAIAYETEYTYVYDVRYNTLRNSPKVSIIMPMKDNLKLSKVCIESILKTSTYSNYEIIILDNNSEEKSTKEWLKGIANENLKVTVVKAEFPFNWSKLNNLGIEKSSGEVYIFLNNDMKVITNDWIERLAENALREEIGVVGAQLLYEDNTIQHAGVVVGLNGYADHIFKGMQPRHYGSPYVSPVINRNVTAVTGACMAISKNTISKIGYFNEDFIICGSDVEMCLRAYESGLNNLYNSKVKLYHYESKSRDSYIPDIDFQLSNKFYSQFLQFGDPYFNMNLSITNVIPTENSEDVGMYANFKNYLIRNRITNFIYKNVKKIVKGNIVNYEIPEIQPITPRFTDKQFHRYNLIVPSVNKEHVFGGISTALQFFHELVGTTDYSRIIITDSVLDKNEMVSLPGYEIVHCDEISGAKNQIVEFSNRSNQSIEVGKNDIFIATAWWTAYNIIPVLKWQNEKYDSLNNSLIYLIQDYEPGFYPWSSRYLLAESTYKTDMKITAVFNSKELASFFEAHNYAFQKTYIFEPKLNNDLKAYLTENKPTERKKQILIYGRPSTQRNGFELTVLALKKWAEIYPESKGWTIYSVGEKHADIRLSDSIIIKSLGKLSLEQYAQLMIESYVGISLMVSPHPSYPPLEMATFGMKVITNRYENKDLQGFNDNIISLDSCSELSIANTLRGLITEFSSEKILDIDLNSEYLNNLNLFQEISKQIKK